MGLLLSKEPKIQDKKSDKKRVFKKIIMLKQNSF